MKGGLIMQVCFIGQSQMQVSSLKSIIQAYDEMRLKIFSTMDLFLKGLPYEYKIVFVEGQTLSTQPSSMLQRFIDVCETYGIDIHILKEVTEPLEEIGIRTLVEKHHTKEKSEGCTYHKNMDLDTEPLVYEWAETMEVSNTLCATKKRIKIGILSAIPGSGASFLTINMAKTITEAEISSTVLELGESQIYTWIKGEERFSEGGFFSYFNSAEKEFYITKVSNVSDGINWAIKLPDESPLESRSEVTERLIDLVEGEMIVCDFSGVKQASEQKAYLKKMDVVIIVIDPSPNKYACSAALIKDIKEQHPFVLGVINKMTEYVDEKLISACFLDSDMLKLPYCDLKYIHESEYKGEIPIKNKPIRCILEIPILNLIETVLSKKIQADKQWFESS